MKNTGKIKHETREGWLLAATALIRPFFVEKGYTVPEVRVSCGWPSHRALSVKGKVIGQAWCKTAASDKIAQVFITPWLNNPTDAQGILPTLVHELVHVTVGNKEGHNKVFGKCARAVLLEGKLTQTYAGKELLELCSKWNSALGVFPHGKLDSNKRPVKKQSTRLIKCECKKSGYICRTTRAWIEKHGAPISPATKQVMTYEIPDELEFDGEDGDQ
jgi:hypothetical protein